MDKIKKTIALILALAFALPLFIMPISAAEEPNIDELIEMTKESELFLSIFYNYPKMVTGESDQLKSEEVEFAKKMGYYDPEFDVGGMQWPFSCVNLITEEIVEKIDFGYGHKFPDAITVERVREDVKKYFVSDFLEIIDTDYYDVTMMTARCYLGTDGHVYNHWYGQFPIAGALGHPDFEDPKILEKTDKKIRLGFNTIGVESESYNDVIIEYRKTSIGWRIAGAESESKYKYEYYTGYVSIFAPEVPETADNSIVYIALASVSLAALAGVTLVSAKRKKAYIA